MIPVNFIFLALSIYLVLTEVKYIERVLPDNIHLLDIRYGYTSSDVLILANLLGMNGRYEYAKFQIGTDTLAPPGFVGFISSVVLSTVKNRAIFSTCIVIIWFYLTSVLLANALTPIFILNYEYYISNSSGDSFLQLLLKMLLFLIPWFDYLKYSSHAIAWLLVFLDWILQLFNTLVSHKNTTSNESDDDLQKKRN